MQRELFINQLERVALYAVTHYIDSATAKTPVNEEDKSLITWIYKCIFVGIAIDWLNNGMSYDIPNLLTRIYTLYDDLSENIFLKVSKSDSDN